MTFKVQITLNAVDEYVDICEVVLIFTFLWAISKGFRIIGEIHRIESRHGTTKGTDFFSKFNLPL